MAIIAQDILAIPASKAGVEHLFNKGIIFAIINKINLVARL